MNDATFSLTWTGTPDGLLKTNENEPIRFLALRTPVKDPLDGRNEVGMIYLLEPYLRIEIGKHAEEIIQNTAVDLVIHGSRKAAYPEQCPITGAYHTFDELKRIAEHLLKREKDYPKIGYQAAENWITFRHDRGGGLAYTLADAKPFPTFGKNPLQKAIARMACAEVMHASSNGILKQ